MEPNDNKPNDNKPNDNNISAGGSVANATTTATTQTVTTTIKRRRVIEKVGVGRRAPWWLWLLPLLPAVVAAASFGNKHSSVAVAADTTVAVAVDTTVAVAAETTVAIVPDTTAAAAADTTHAVDTIVAPDTTIAAATTVAAAASTDVVGVALPSEQLTKFNAAIAAAGLVPTLQGKGPFTVFAPSDAAFAALPPGVLDTHLKPENKEALTQVLTYHVVPQRLEQADLKPGTYATVDGHSVTLADDGSKVAIADPTGPANVIVPGASADNGLVYVIDRVLLPPGFVVPGATNGAGDAVSEDLTVYFDVNRAAITTEASTKLDKAVTVLKALPPGTKVALVGHADTTRERCGKPGTVGTSRRCRTR